MQRYCIDSDDFKKYNAKVEKFKKTHFEHIREVYLDHAGAAIHSNLHISNFMKDLAAYTYGNPHSNNISSRRTIEMIEEVRKKTLEHFNTSLQEYSVIFVQNSSAALSLVAECFKFNGCVHQNGSTNTQTNSRIKIFLDDEANLTNSGSTRARAVGTLAYLDDSHTSVIGMRGPVGRKGVKVFCLSEKELKKELSSRHLKVAARKLLRDDNEEKSCNNLFIYPAQSNFSGYRYQLTWIEKIQTSEQFLGIDGRWYVLIDAASILTTSTVDLSIFKPDFLVFSFYKIFGFPTGLGCLLVKNSSQNIMEKCYFGGGTIDILLPGYRIEVFKSDFSERFEDGTLPYLEILAAKHGFDAFNELAGSIAEVSQHTFALACFTYNELKNLKFNNGQKVIELYHAGEFQSQENQGPVINFNVLKTDGCHLGFSQVDEMAKLHNICLRTGCFCNIGACQKFLEIAPQEMVDNYNLGHVCGDSIDLIGGRTTGSIRVSFGFSSTFSDVEKFLEFIRICFLERGNKTLNESSWEKTLISRGSNERWLQEVWIYPIKSCSGLQMDTCPINSRGLKDDRKWMLLNQSGRVITQKDAPGLCKIKCLLFDRILRVQTEGFQDLIISDKDETSSNVSYDCVGRVCGDQVSTKKHDLKINQWFSSVLMKDVALVKQLDSDKRKSRKDPNCLLSFANEAQFLLIGSSSLELLYKKMKSGNELLFSINDLAKRFRANFVVHTVMPFEEDYWNEIKIGQETFKKVGLCIRCNIICFDQATGKASKEPLLTLMNFPGRKANFGILLVHCSEPSERQAGVSVGDVIEVLKYD